VRTRAVELEPGLGPGDEGGTKGKARQTEQFGPEVGKLKDWMKKVVMDAEHNASQKWTWGMDLTDEDLLSLIRGADSKYQLPHSGYDQDLSTGVLQSHTSDALDPAHLEDWNDSDLLFDVLSTPINVIPELRSPEIPTLLFRIIGPIRRANRRVRA